MKYLSNFKIENKNVLLRCDFNVSIKDGKIIDNSKIIKSLDTINYLLENHNKVIIFSHFGRVKEAKDLAKNSLYPVYLELKKYIDAEFIENPTNLVEINYSDKRCFLVENTRFTDIPEKLESVNDLVLAKYWASFGDVFIVDAFASLHRAHSSVAGIAKYLPTYFGFLVEKEIKNLRPLINVEKRPFVVVMGGAKVDDKIKIIKNIIPKCDKLVLTGGILNTFLKVQNKDVGNSLVSNDEEVLEDVRTILDKYKEKIVYSDNFTWNDGAIYDNIPKLNAVLKDAQLVFVNGTCGKYEDADYELGTKTLFNELKNCAADIYIGGGDTVGAVTKLGFDKDFKYLASGGGATLEYVANGHLKAIDWIEENSVDN